ncbi:MAG: hypothetical protein WC373_05245 [Smithella sp.]|jgi:hypothetical protein
MKDINKKINKSIFGNSATIGWHLWWQGGINQAHYKKYCQIYATLATLFFYMVAECNLYFIRLACRHATLPPCFFIYNNNNKKDIYIGGCPPFQPKNRNILNIPASFTKQGGRVAEQNIIYKIKNVKES